MVALGDGAGLLSVNGCPTNLDDSMARTHCACIRVLSFLSPSLEEPQQLSGLRSWLTDLVDWSLIPARGEIFSTVNGVPLHTAFHYQTPIVLI